MKNHDRKSRRCVRFLCEPWSISFFVLWFQVSRFLLSFAMANSDPNSLKWVVSVDSRSFFALCCAYRLFSGHDPFTSHMIASLRGYWLNLKRNLQKEERTSTLRFKLFRPKVNLSGERQSQTLISQIAKMAEGPLKVFVCLMGFVRAWSRKLGKLCFCHW